MPTDQKGFTQVVHQHISRREVIRAGALAALGLTFTAPFIQSQNAISALQEYPPPVDTPIPQVGCAPPTNAKRSTFQNTTVPCNWSDWIYEDTTGGGSIESVTHNAPSALQTSTPEQDERYRWRWRVRCITPNGAGVVKVTLTRMKDGVLHRFERYYNAICNNGNIQVTFWREVDKGAIE